MRPEDIIAAFLERLDLTRRSPDDAALDLIEVLEKHQLYVNDGVCGECDCEWEE